MSKGRCSQCQSSNVGVSQCVSCGYYVCNDCLEEDGQCIECFGEDFDDDLPDHWNREEE